MSNRSDRWLMARRAAPPEVSGTLPEYVRVASAPVAGPGDRRVLVVADEEQSFVAVVSGRIKTRPTAEPFDEAQVPEPVPLSTREGEPFVIIVDTGLPSAAVGRTDDPERQPNRTDAWARRFELADPAGYQIDHLDVLGPPGLDLGAGHGTFVAGLIGRVTAARIVMLRAFDTDGICRDTVLADAIRTAGRMFARRSRGRGVLNLSCAVETPDGSEPPVLRSALATLPEQVVVVAAAGHESGGDPVWPAASPRTLAVGAIDADGNRPEWSNSGEWLDFSTLGVGLTGPYVIGTETQGSGEDGDPFDPHPDTFPGPNPFATWEGTSFATAQVSGAAANVLLANPDVTHAGVKAALVRQADGWSADVGHHLTML